MKNKITAEMKKSFILIIVYLLIAFYVDYLFIKYLLLFAAGLNFEDFMVAWRIKNGEHPLAMDAAPDWRIAKMDIKPGDVLVIKFKSHPPMDVLVNFRNELKEKIGVEHIIFLIDDAEIVIVPPARIN